MGMKTDTIVYNKASEVLHLLLQVHRHHLLAVQYGSRGQTDCHLDLLRRPTIPGLTKVIAATLYVTTLEEDLHLHPATAVKEAERPASTRTFLATPAETRDVEVGMMGRGETIEMIGPDRWKDVAKIIENLDGVEVLNET
jgi:hypothetical protein